MASRLELVVDSSVWIDYYRGAGRDHESWLDKAFETRTILVPNLVLLEVLRGLPDEKSARSIEWDMRGNAVLSLDGAELAVKAAANFRHLRQIGRTVRSSIDLLIGTWCIETETQLLHNDRDFDVMEQHIGLKVWRGEA